MTIDYIYLTQDLHLDYKQAEKIIDHNTALVACTHLSNVIGTQNDVKAITQLAHNVGAYSVVDAAQSISHMPVDVQQIGCDFLFFSGHKMFAPTGVGVLYAEHQQDMQVYQVGGDMINSVEEQNATWAQPPQKFEAGTPPIEAIIGLDAAIDFINQQQIIQIEQQVKQLSIYARQQLETIPGIQIFNGSPTGIIAFTIKDIHPHDMTMLLAQKNICIRVGHHCAMPLLNYLKQKAVMRISLHIYNTQKDIDTLIDQIQKNREMLR